VTVNCLAAEDAPALVSALTETGHRAAAIGEVLDGPTTITIVYSGLRGAYSSSRESRSRSSSATFACP
jgi:hydrogenase maturation factor